MSSKSYEGGIRPYRLEFARESVVGEAPTDPTYMIYSDNARTLEPEISPESEAQRGLGDPDPKDHFAGTEAHSLTVSYDLQQWIIDGSGNALDALYDGIQRDSDNRLPNSHTVVRRMEQSELDPSNTVNGSTSYDTRQFIVGKGGYVDSVTITGDPTDPQPVLVELNYEFEKARVYQIDQPDSGSQLDVESTDDSDDSQTLTIEDEGAGTTEDVDLSGTTTQTTTGSFSGIDAAHLSAETAGDVTISITGGDTLMTIKGQDSYDQGEGDLGVPALGSGSHASSIGTAYELFHGDTVERPSGTSLSDNLNSTEITIENNVDGTERAAGPRRALAANERTPTVDATVFGETEHFQQIRDALTVAANDLVWTFDGGSITIPNSKIMSSSGSEEVSQGIKEIDVTMEGEGVTVA